MVVFPAPSSPRMRILISRVPNKLEKMVEKKPPTKSRRERHFNVSQLCGGYAKADRPTSFLTGLQDASFLQWKKTSSGCCPDGCVLNYIMSSWFMLPFYGSMIARSSKLCCSSIKLSHCGYTFIFSFSLICQNLSHLLFCLYQTLSFQCQRLHKDQKKPEKIQHQKMFMVFHRTIHFFFLKIRYKSVSTC